MMWMTREEIAAAMGIVPNSVRGKVQKGQIERKVEEGKNYYRMVESRASEGNEARTASPEPPPTTTTRPVPEVKKSRPEAPGAFNPKQVLLDQLVSIKVGRSIDAIEKGDEIDLATGEISRELDAKISMRQHKQLKEIEEALERIKHGEYGVCEECGETIPEQRLRLFPAAKLCVRCQEEADYYEKMKDTQGIRGGTWREESTDSGYVKSFED
jgi:DnaK suppressor protein